MIIDIGVARDSPIGLSRRVRGACYAIAGACSAGCRSSPVCAPVRDRPERSRQKKPAGRKLPPRPPRRRLRAETEPADKTGSAAPVCVIAIFDLDVCQCRERFAIRFLEPISALGPHIVSTADTEHRLAMLRSFPVEERLIRVRFRCQKEQIRQRVRM
jgi:hypothetical protein